MLCRDKNYLLLICTLISFLKRKLSFEKFFDNKLTFYLNFSEIDKLGLLESRFLVCAMTSIGTRMFGNGNFY